MPGDRKRVYTVGSPLRLVGPQSRLGGKLLKNRVVCRQNWTAVLKEKKGALLRDTAAWGETVYKKRPQISARHLCALLVATGWYQFLTLRRGIWLPMEGTSNPQGT